ncbi:MAG: O-antigen ligase family protein, partial [Planctomycetes bacterium]|nr:O-antigen ligase family protein [Planctomycetota bacterium]
MKRLIESVSFGIILVVVALRPLVAESYDSAGNPITAALGSVSDPSPVGTLVFDMAILVSAVGWLFARAIGSHQLYRRTGLEWGSLIIMLAAIVSCCFAGHKRLAITATIDWLCYLVLAMVLVQLLRHRWRQRVLIAAIVGTACVQAVQCFDQHFVGFEDTWAQYEEIKDEFWARQGVDQDSAKVELFENRIQARESSGFLPHSNLTGSYLMLCGLVALGVSVSGLRRSRDFKSVLAPVACGVVAAGILTAVLTTKSNGAILAGVFGLAVWLLIHTARRWIDSHRTRALLVGWALAAIGLSSTVGLGLMNDRLPHMSLTFRWQYWKTSSQLIADHPLAGVGRENFGRHYLQYKTIDSPEEVSNPHDLLVQAAADWGLPGLTGLIVAMIGVSLTLARRPIDQSEAGGQNRTTDRPPPEIG